jgi:outer membrane protein TolC
MQPRLARLILPPALFAAGCATYRPEPLDPAEETAALRSRSVDEVSPERIRAATGIPRPGVFDPSDGLDEDEVVSAALVLNPDLRAKRLEVGEARAELITAGLWPNPRIELSAGRGLQPGGGMILNVDLLMEMLRTAEHSAKIDAATARVEEVRAGIVAEEWRLAAEVRRQLLAVLAAERTADLLDGETALRERTREILRRRRELGEGTELDVAAADLDAVEVRRERSRARAEQEVAARELNRLLGLPPAYALRLGDSGKPLAITVAEEPADDEVDRRILAGRPDLKALEAGYRRAEQDLRLAVEKQVPRLELGPALGRESGGDWSLGAGLGIELPLSDRNQGEIAGKESLRQRARAEYAAALQRARAEAFDALARMRSARSELDAVQRDLLPLVQRTQDLAERAFRAGEVGVLDWITAQQRTLTTKKAVLESAVRYRAAVIDFEAAAGLPTAPVVGPAGDGTKPR